MIFLLFAILFSFIIYDGQQYKKEQDARFVGIERNFQEQLNLQMQANASTSDALTESIKIIENNLALTKNESKALSDILSKEQQKIDSLKEETKKIGGAVDTLEKLRQIDEELLKKYSKVFFLNENYVPVRLSEIKNQYLYSEKETKYLLSDVLLFLTDMIDDALAQNIDIYVKSAYRSFNEQDNLKGDYTVLYGETTASQFSADQGYSEHQLGTTVDFITKGLNGQLPGFENTEAYEWLTQNAYKYGFALSYPEGNP